MVAISSQTMVNVKDLMVFNCVARNQDDHVKNIAFLMNKKGEWQLAPAFDVTYSYHPQGLWTNTHQMSLNGKRDNFLAEDFNPIGKFAGLKRGYAKRVLKEIVEVVNQWPDFALKVGVDTKQIKAIKKTHRLSF